MDIAKVMINSWRKAANAVLAALSVLILVKLYSVYQRGYSWEEMDWNSDGVTSIFEVLESTDVETRKFEADGKVCTEYVASKDASIIKKNCEK
jgi:hypothetical protein